MRKKKSYWKEICVNLFVFIYIAFGNYVFELDHDYIVVRKNLNAEISIE
jgi:hypothetical protein|tara:strand:+ start:1325 stop:1471 length:147 start_codon:yes stop_codon:yes gene_type:complete